MASSCTDNKPLISVEPGELAFPYELKKETSCKLRLSNNTQQTVAFKVKTTILKKSWVRPNIGLILAGSTCDITVHMQGLTKAISGFECEDKFLIESVVAGDGTTTENAWKLFKEPEASVEITKLRATYIFPSQTESSKSDRARANASAMQQMVRLLDVNPQELTFPFELGKQASCQLLLSNNTLMTVAFKVMTTDPKKYCVRPNSGLILAGSTCDVTVLMRGPKEGTPDIECKDKFMIKSVIARVDVSSKSAYELFNEPVDAVEELKLKVKYVTPSHTESSDSEIAQKETPVKAPTVQDESLKRSEVTPDQGKRWSSLRWFLQKCQHYWLPDQENAATDMALSNAVVKPGPVFSCDADSFYHELGDKDNDDI